MIDNTLFCFSDELFIKCRNEMFTDQCCTKFSCDKPNLLWIKQLDVVVSPPATCICYDLHITHSNSPPLILREIELMIVRSLDSMSSPDRWTNGKWHIWSHHAICTSGLKPTCVFNLGHHLHGKKTLVVTHRGRKASCKPAIRKWKLATGKESNVHHIIK